MDILEIFTSNIRVLSNFLGCALFLFGCVGQPFEQNAESDKSIIKFERLKTTTVEMYTYSTAYSETPTFIIAEKGGKKDTICRTTNITDFDLDKDTLWLYFYGKPKLYNQVLTIDKMLFNEKIIVVDTFGR